MKVKERNNLGEKANDHVTKAFFSPKPRKVMGVGRLFGSSFLSLHGKFGSLSQTVWEKTYAPGATPIGNIHSGNAGHGRGQNGPPA